MSTVLKKQLLFIGMLALSGFAQAQRVLDSYIKEAFSSNNGLKQEHLQLDKALNALQQAKTLYYPNMSVLGSYTRAAGGRTIDFPVGDLLNPAYHTLNELTGTNNFPTLQNASILLNPDDFYDVKLRTSMPLINAEIWYNKKIKNTLVSERTAAVNVYKRELVKKIKEAYYQYLLAQQAVAIYDHALALVNENVRVNESLVRNGVKNTTVLLKARAEKEKITTSLEQAQHTVKNAQLYFNFLLNRKGDADITADTTLLTDAPASLTTQTGSKREELLQLDAVITAQQLAQNKQRNYLIPKVNTFLDLGSQNFKFKFTEKSRYFLWGLNLQWDLFAAGQNKYKIQQAGNEVALARVQYDETNNALKMQADMAANNYASAVSTYKNATTQLQLADKYYRDELRLYKEGSALYLELTDALNQLTAAQIQEKIARVNILIAAADIERQNATYNIQ